MDDRGKRGEEELLMALCKNENLICFPSEGKSIFLTSSLGSDVFSVSFFLFFSSKQSSSCAFMLNLLRFSRRDVVRAGPETQATRRE